MPCGKESSPRIAIGRKLLTEEPSCEAEDMTAPTISATPKIALDQRATSRHDNAHGFVSRLHIGDWHDGISYV
jgi:hypothetical protein